MIVVMTNYKKKDSLDTYENNKKIQTNLNISNNIKNVWMDVSKINLI